MDKHINTGALPVGKEHKIFTVEHEAACTDPYVSTIASFLRTVVTGAKMSNFKEILNLLEEAFYASGEIRFGSKPDVEHLYRVRSIITDYMDAGKPVPILVPWGSIKGKFGMNLDMAEVSAINQMIHLYERVTKFYKPGVEFVIRVEDASGYQLFDMDDKEGHVPTHIEKYIRDFRSLVCIMDYTESIGVLFESEMPGAVNFTAEVEKIIPLFDKYLKDSDHLLSVGAEDEGLESLESYKALHAIGWMGLISPTQRNYYYNTYRKLYNTPNEDGVRYRLALYMAQALTRRKLNMSGVQSRWNYGFVQLTFVPPVPGVPEGYDLNYIYYRTMPESATRLHMAPWRSKGYLKIVDNGGDLKITPKLANWHEEKEYRAAEITLKNKTHQVTLSMDYILETSK